ncbi:MAG: alpha/beta hydrolase [Actinomycetota bacterium]|nr:alpha/beta hydrolase [Actinomycetota bacterium]
MGEAGNTQGRTVLSPDEESGGVAAGRAGYAVSEDGTAIGYWRRGEGAPLVLVHGTSADHARWAPVLPALGERFTVYVVDRRGQEGSGDAADHSLEREVEDVVAVVDSIGAPVCLLGHSYGAICSLEAASRRAARVGGLVLYEPPIPTGMVAFPAEAVERVEALIEENHRGEAVALFLREVAGMPPREVDRLRAEPAWHKRVVAAHTLPREARAAEGYVLDPARLREFGTPTLLLLGGESPPFFRAATEAVDEALPDSRIVVMPGQGHVAMHTAPELFASLVVGFLAAPGRTYPRDGRKEESFGNR